MKLSRWYFPAFVPIVCLLFVFCGVLPQVFVPQKDVNSLRVASEVAEKNVLIASRKSDFKEAIVTALIDSLNPERVVVQVTGIKDLAKFPAGEFDAVVVLNTCMGWSMDRKVKSYLDRSGEVGHILVVTTSGDGAWMPSEKDREYDAIASASEKTRIEPVTSRILQRVREQLKAE